MCAQFEPVCPGSGQPTLRDAAAMKRGDAGAPACLDGDGWSEALVVLLNGALATELVGALRNKRHHFTAQGVASPHLVAALAAHAARGLMHADRLAGRIVQLGGRPDFDPDSLRQRSQAAYDAQLTLPAMIAADLAAEHLLIESYGKMVHLIRNRDPGTRRLLETLRADKQRHAEQLQAWLCSGAIQPCAHCMASKDRS